MVKKALFISGLVTVAVSASIFMVYESSKFYASHYMNDWQGIWLAAMLEMFVMLLAMVKIGGVFRQIAQKSMMMIIFFIIIFAAGLYAVAPTLKSFTTAKQNQALQELLGNEIKSLDDELKVFDKQKQRGNTAKSANRREKAYTELKELLKKDVVTNKNEIAIINIILLFIIRLAVQTANIYCAWMIGFIYRDSTTLRQEKPKGKPPLCICGCGQPVRMGKNGQWNKAIDGHQFSKGALEAYRKEKSATSNINRTRPD